MFRSVVRSLIAVAAMSAVAVGISPAQAAPVSTTAPITAAAPVVATPRLVEVDVQEFRRFDRILLRFRNGVPDLRARYVRAAFDQDGDRVRLPGRELLVLRLEPARARSLDQGVERVDLDNVRAFRLIEDRRGVVRIAVGLRERVGVRVSERRNLLIIDVAHRDRF